jgi:hypothetical protein
VDIERWAKAQERILVSLLHPNGASTGIPRRIPMGDALNDAPRRLAPFHGALIGQGFALFTSSDTTNYLATMFPNWPGEIARAPREDGDDWIVDVWNATHPTNDVGQRRGRSISMVRAVQDGIQEEAEAVRHMGEDEVDWMVAHLDTRERLVTDRATWACLHAFGRPHRQQRVRDLATR